MVQEFPTVSLDFTDYGDNQYSAAVNKGAMSTFSPVGLDILKRYENIVHTI